MSESPSCYDVTVIVDRDGDYLADPAEFAAAAEQADAAEWLCVPHDLAGVGPGSAGINLASAPSHEGAHAGHDHDETFVDQQADSPAGRHPGHAVPLDHRCL